MPVMHFTVRWPDGDATRCYSPSLVVRDYLEVGRAYPLADFLERSRTMLNIGSERVRIAAGIGGSAAVMLLGVLFFVGSLGDGAGL